jgi:hypothetical protein
LAKSFSTTDSCVFIERLLKYYDVLPLQLCNKLTRVSKFNLVTKKKNPHKNWWLLLVSQGNYNNSQNIIEFSLFQFSPSKLRKLNCILLPAFVQWIALLKMVLLKLVVCCIFLENLFICLFILFFFWYDMSGLFENTFYYPSDRFLKHQVFFPPQLL